MNIDRDRDFRGLKEKLGVSSWSLPHTSHVSVLRMFLVLDVFRRVLGSSVVTGVARLHVHVLYFACTAVLFGLYLRLLFSHTVTDGLGRRLLDTIRVLRLPCALQEVLRLFCAPQLDYSLSASSTTITIIINIISSTTTTTTSITTTTTTTIEDASRGTAATIFFGMTCLD